MSDADTDQHRPALTARPHLPLFFVSSPSFLPLRPSSPYLFRRTPSFGLWHFLSLRPIPARGRTRKPIQKHTRAHGRTPPSQSKSPVLRSVQQPMGAGKGGGDGGAEEAAAAEPVVLKMELHCAGCAEKVKKAIKRVPGTVCSFHPSIFGDAQSFFVPSFASFLLLSC